MLIQATAMVYLMICLRDPWEDLAEPDHELFEKGTPLK